MVSTKGEQTGNGRKGTRRMGHIASVNLSDTLFTLSPHYVLPQSPSPSPSLPLVGQTWVDETFLCQKTQMHMKTRMWDGGWQGYRGRANVNDLATDIVTLCL